MPAASTGEERSDERGESPSSSGDEWKKDINERREGLFVPLPPMARDLVEDARVRGVANR